MKLTAAEKAWVKKLQVLLDECPSKRLGFYTIGDPEISIYDRSKEKEINEVFDAGKHDFCSAVAELDAGAIESLRFPAQVHSTAG